MFLPALLGGGPMDLPRPTVTNGQLLRITWGSTLAASEVKRATCSSGLPL